MRHSAEVDSYVLILKAGIYILYILVDQCVELSGHDVVVCESLLGQTPEGEQLAQRLVSFVGKHLVMRSRSFFLALSSNEHAASVYIVVLRPVVLRSCNYFETAADSQFAEQHRVAHFLFIQTVSSDAELLSYRVSYLNSYLLAFHLLGDGNLFKTLLQEFTDYERVVA